MATEEITPPYTAIPDGSGCEHCGGGRLWTVQGPNGTCEGRSWSDAEDAEQFADDMNRAYAAGLARALSAEVRVRESFGCDGERFIPVSTAALSFLKDVDLVRTALGKFSPYTLEKWGFTADEAKAVEYLYGVAESFLFDTATPPNLTEAQRDAERYRWQPIETAPRDGRKVLVGGFNVYHEWWVDLAWWRRPYEEAPATQCSWCYDKDGTLLDASIHRSGSGTTHWMPLPAGPESMAKDAQG